MKVLVTGASGHVAQQMIGTLASHHDVVLADMRITPKLTNLNLPTAECNLLTASDDELAKLFEGVDVVVHCAFLDLGGGEVYDDRVPQIDRFDAEFQNILMAQRVYKASLQAGVRRVVMASSNHAADWYEHNEVHKRRRELIAPEDYPLSDSFYGWSKASYELLAYPYACGTFGRQLEFVFLRIGSPYPIDPASFEGDIDTTAPQPFIAKPRGLAGFKRALGAFLSERDSAQLFLKAVEAEGISDAHGNPWLVVYGISDNTRAFWSLTSARVGLGYEPEDDSEVLYADAVRRLLTQPDNGRPDPGRLGS